LKKVIKILLVQGFVSGHPVPLSKNFKIRGNDNDAYPDGTLGGVDEEVWNFYKVMGGYLRSFVLVLTICLNIFAPTIILAEEPTNTWTISVDGDFIQTQTAYEAMAIIAHEYLSRPEDLFIGADGNLFVADSYHGHIAIFDQNRNFLQTVGSGILNNPTGVFVTDYIFVADTEDVFVFNLDGTLVNEIGRPDSPLFGRAQPFRPRKIAVDVRGNLYVIGEAANNGIIQLNADGEFLGYFGANQARLSFFQALQNFFGVGRFAILPTPPSNLAIADNGVVFTVTTHAQTERVRKLNIAGNNMFDPDWVFPLLPIDIALGNQGNFYMMTSDGSIWEYDSSANLLFVFGGQDPNQQRFGIIHQPTSIEVSSDGNLYVADAESGFIHIFAPTEFTNTVHHALTYFEEGLYTQSEDYWQEVLRLNSSFRLAHIAIGQSRFIQADYEEALARFYIANYIAGYSEAFWELRHEWLMENMGAFIALFLVLLVIRALLKQVDKRTGKVRAVKSAIHQKIDSPFLQELDLMRRIFKQPFDVFYEIKREKKGSLKFATGLYIVMFIVTFIAIHFAGFIFAINLIEERGVPLITTIFVLGFGLFLIINYLISTITDGEGSFRDLYVATAYSMVPFITLAIPITLLSRGLTLNEGFVYTFLMQIAIGWSVLLIFLMVKEIHDFSISQTIKNLILTVSGGLITVIIGFILYILIVDQVFDFIYSIVWEVLLRV